MGRSLNIYLSQVWIERLISANGSARRKEIQMAIGWNLFQADNLA